MERILEASMLGSFLKAAKEKMTPKTTQKAADTPMSAENNSDENISESFEPGQLVWIPDDKECFVKAVVVRTQNAEQTEIVVEVLDRQKSRSEREKIVPAKKLSRRSKDNCDAEQDCTALEYLSPASILDNLQRRYLTRDVYTYTSHILLAVNPYEEIENLYSQENERQYRDKPMGVLPPHPFAVSDTAYRYMKCDGVNQTVIISGESGAGKTETAKIITRFLVGRSTGSSSSSSINSVKMMSDISGRSIQEKLLQVTPILESLGNAQTVRNYNSSRFGKYTKLIFEDRTHLVAAEINTYLLEASRVIRHANLERNYHVFYQLLAGLHTLPKEQQVELSLMEGPKRPVATPSKKRKSITGPKVDSHEQQGWRLLNPDEKLGTVHGEVTSRRMNSDDDLEGFKKLENAFDCLGVDRDCQFDIWKVLAGILFLGEVLFAEQENTSELTTVITNPDVAKRACSLLGLDYDRLDFQLTRYHIGREKMVVHRTAEACESTRDALIKRLYCRFFDYIVAVINKELMIDLKDKKLDDELSNLGYIGILDIYGFERLLENSFEQCCINFANERLQDFFIQKVLVREQELYAEECLPYTPVKLPKNAVAECVKWIFKQLDDQAFSKKGSDDAFIKNVSAVWNRGTRGVPEVVQGSKVVGPASRKNLAGKKRRLDDPEEIKRFDQSFTLQHYAGQVEYYGVGWVQKNSDRLLPEGELLLQNSTHPVIKTLVNEVALKAKSERSTSVSASFRTGLDDLIMTMSSCALHFIRCYNPNAEQKARVFKRDYLLNQVIQSGTIQVVNIFNKGFPHRMKIEEIFNRFSSILPPGFENHGPRDCVSAMMDALDVPQKDWALGQTLLFLKAGQLALLESMRGLTGEAKEMIVKKLRATLVVKKLKGLLEATIFANLMVPKIRKIQRRKKLLAVFSWTSKAVGFFKTVLKKRRARIRQENLRKNTGIVRQVTRFVVLMKRLLRQRRERQERIRKQKLERNLSVFALSTNFVVLVKRFKKKRNAEIERQKQLKKNLAVFYCAVRAMILVRRYLLRKEARVRVERRDRLLSVFVLSTRVVCFAKRCLQKRRARLLAEEQVRKEELLKKEQLEKERLLKQEQIEKEQFLKQKKLEKEQLEKKQMEIRFQKRDRLLSVWVLSTRVVCFVKRCLKKRRAKVLAEAATVKINAEEMDEAEVARQARSRHAVRLPNAMEWTQRSCDVDYSRYGLNQHELFPVWCDINSETRAHALVYNGAVLFHLASCGSMQLINHETGSDISISNNGSDCFPELQDTLVAVAQHPEDPHLFCAANSANHILLMGFNGGSGSREAPRPTELVVYYGKVAPEHYRRQRIQKIAFVPSSGGEVRTAVCSTSIDNPDNIWIDIFQWDAEQRDEIKSLYRLEHKLKPSREESTVNCMSVDSSGSLLSIAGRGFWVVWNLDAQNPHKIFPPASVDYLSGAAITNLQALSTQSMFPLKTNHLLAGSSVGNYSESFLASTDQNSLLLLTFERSVGRTWQPILDSEKDPLVLDLGVTDRCDAIFARAASKSQQIKDAAFRFVEDRNELQIGASTACATRNEIEHRDNIDKVITAHYSGIDLENVVDKENLPRNMKSSSSKRPLATEFRFWQWDHDKNKLFNHGEGFAVLGEKWERVCSTADAGGKRIFYGLGKSASKKGMHVFALAPAGRTERIVNLFSRQVPDLVWDEDDLAK